MELPLSYEEIIRLLPHRYPFLFVDRITELEPEKRVVGLKNVTGNEEQTVIVQRRCLRAARLNIALERRSRSSTGRTFQSLSRRTCARSSTMDSAGSS